MNSDVTQSTTRSVRQFYEDYHRGRVRTPNAWMQRVYWPAFRGSVLEIGGGTLFPQRANYTMVDLSSVAASRAVSAGHAGAVADGTVLPFPDRSFDTVACYDTLEHVVTPVPFIAEMCRVARKRIVIAGPNWIGRHGGGVSRYLPLRLWSLLTDSNAGWTPVTDAHLSFDEDWSPDADAVSLLNAGWVAKHVGLQGYTVRHVRTWEYAHSYLNLLPYVRCLGPFMFVVGVRRPQ